jgi:branched-chain amino acid transport system substrate-binding protein
VYVSAVDSTDVAVGQALHNAGLSTKALYATGYDQQVLSQHLSTAALDQGYFTATVNMTTPNAATQQMLNALKQYDPSYHGGLPDIGTVFAYLSADLMVKGLQLAGANPTRAGFISNLRQLTGYNAGGLLPFTLSYTNFGTVAGLPATDCGYLIQLRSGQYQSLNGGQPFCGTLVPLG